MWFQYSTGKEKIKFMFNNEFIIDDVELVNFLFNDDAVRFQFCCKQIPKFYPKKWDEEGFNAISLVISFVDMKSFECKGIKTRFVCTPEIESNKDKSSIKIESDDFYLFCSSRFLSINGITPYIDERWD